MIDEKAEIQLRIDGLLIDDIDKRDFIPWYVKALLFELQGKGHFNWYYINQQIEKKWGLKGLKQVKGRAWKILQESKAKTQKNI